MGIFRYDSPLMQFLSRAADLIWVNLLVLVCSIPVFTIGPACSALSRVSVNLVRDESSSILKEFFLSFLRDFGKAVVLGLHKSAFDTAQRNAGNDILRQCEIHHKQRQNSQRQAKVDRAELTLVDIALEQRHHQRHRELVHVGQDNAGDEQAVPRADEGEDRLGRHGGLHDRHGDMVEGVEFLRAINTGRIQQFQREATRA